MSVTTSYPAGSYCDLVDRRYVEDPESLSEEYRWMGQIRRDERAAQMPAAIAEITALPDVVVRRLTEHQYRVEGGRPRMHDSFVIDLYPSTRKFVVVSGPQKGRRGTYETAALAIERARK